MDSDDITPEMAARIHRSLFRLANYLARLVKRMEQTGFPPADSGPVKGMVVGEPRIERRKMQFRLDILH